MEKFKLLNRKLIHKGHVVEFYEDELKLPDGHVVKYDVLHHNGAAAIVPVDEDGKILMVRQYRHAVSKVTLEIPAGKLDPGEDGMQCAIRECEEETGYKAGETHHLFDLFTTLAYCDEKIAVYYTTGLTKSKQNLDDDEFVNVERYTLDELTDLILQGTIQDSKTIAAILAYKTKCNL
ncbi:ADP-ribose pyrophosphatase [Lachnospiraceae bacterium KM106-2]|nr:ADP-ribose pyrophosphatase [Lachnospiraceae bacterium KM106-2]